MISWELKLGLPAHITIYHQDQHLALGELLKELTFHCGEGEGGEGGLTRRDTPCPCNSMAGPPTPVPIARGTEQFKHGRPSSLVRAYEIIFQSLQLVLL